MSRRVVTWRDVKRGGAKEEDSTSEAVAKCVPAEIVTVYAGASATIAALSSPPVWFLWLVFLLGLVVTPLYLWRTATKPGERFPLAQVAIATISFVVWAATLGGPFATIQGFDAAYPAVILPFLTLLPAMALVHKP